MTDHYSDQREGPPVSLLEPRKASTGIKSDGASASYYEFTITNSKGESLQVQTRDVIRCMCENDFDLGNILKACRRISEAKKGQGKKGTPIEYDLNKIIYSAKELLKHAIR